MRRLFAALRRVFIGEPRQLARDAQHAQWVAAEPELRRFVRDLRVAHGQSGIVLGDVRLRDGTQHIIRLPFERIAATHVAISGASGSGKTTLSLDVLDQMVRLPDVRLIGVDPKGDLDEGLRCTRFPLLARELGVEFAGRVRYLRPFAAGAVVPLRFTAREPGVAIQVQALSLATALAEASGIELTPPSVNAFTKLATLAIELGEPLTAIVTWIARPEVFARAARRSADDGLRHYGLVEFAREHRGMLRALQARLESVLLLPSVRSALEAPTCVSFADSLEHHHLLIDLSHPPGGEEAAVRILGGPIIGRMTRAILNRPVTDDSPQVVLAIDELPEILTHYEATSFARLAALARARKITVLTIAQQRIQLGSKLSEVLRTNAGIEVLFRCHAADAEALGHVLPVSPEAERPAEERRALVRRMVSLPQRSYLLWVKDAAVPAHFVRARKVDTAGLRRAAADVPEDLRARLGRWPAEPSPQVPLAESPMARPNPELPPDAPGTDSDPDSDFPNLG